MSSGQADATAINFARGISHTVVVDFAVTVQVAGRFTRIFRSPKITPGPASRLSPGEKLLTNERLKLSMTCIKKY